jgi:hypothetical protein
MEQFRRNGGKARRGIAVRDIADVLVHTKDFGEHKNAARRVLACGPSVPGQHRGSVVNFDFNVFGGDV